MRRQDLIDAYAWLVDGLRARGIETAAQLFDFDYALSVAMAWRTPDGDYKHRHAICAHYVRRIGGEWRQQGDDPGDGYWEGAEYREYDLNQEICFKGLSRDKFIDLVVTHCTPRG